MGKRVVFFRSVFLLTLLVLGGCSKTTVESLVSPVLPEPPNPTRATEFLRDQARGLAANNAPLQPVDVLRYDLKGAFQWDTMRLKGAVTISFRLLTDDVKKLVLNSAVASIQSVTASNGLSLPYSATPDKKLTIDLSGIPMALRTKEMAVTISYEAYSNVMPNGEGHGISAVAARRGDPVLARVVYTFSEPLAAEEWMPCHNDPRDRALFSSEFVMEKGESLISNGDLLMNEIDGQSRRMKYSTRYPLPTYLMAFAVGEFSVTTSYLGSLPVSVWTRKGLPADSDGMVKELSRQIGIYESLLVPYPFEKYSLVLLPEFPSGGIEHAGITFQAETVSTQSQDAHDIGLSAHELAHQWFGDYVTVETWDDLWIKEGMATLLAEEALRIHEDKQKSGRLFGNNFGVTDGDSIVDKSLIPDLKYTDGPYGRAAWLLTQIRATVGEEKFWMALKTVLKRHAFGNIGTEEMLGAFRQDLGESLYQRALHAVEAKALPRLQIGSTADGLSTLTLEDPHDSLLAPMEVRWYTDASHYENAALEVGKPTELPVSDARLLALDPRDLHPTASFIRSEEAFDASLLPHLIPTGATTFDAFLALPASAQLLAMKKADGWDFSADKVDTFLTALGSEEARLHALKLICTVANSKSASTVTKAWKSSITKAVLSPAYLGSSGKTIGSGLSACRPFLDGAVFQGELSEVAENPGTTLISETRLLYLSLLDLAPATAFGVWGSLANGGASVRSRRLGLKSLIKHLETAAPFAKPSAEELSSWKAFFRSVLDNSDAGEVLELAIDATVKTHDREALPHLAKLLRRTVRPSTQKSILCGTRAMLKEFPEGWKSFQEAMGDAKGISSKLQEYLQDPAKLCGK